MKQKRTKKIGVERFNPTTYTIITTMRSDVPV